MCQLHKTFSLDIGSKIHVCKVNIKNLRNVLFNDDLLF